MQLDKECICCSLPTDQLMYIFKANLIKIIIIIRCGLFLKPNNYIILILYAVRRETYLLQSANRSIDVDFQGKLN